MCISRGNYYSLPLHAAFGKKKQVVLLRDGNVGIMIVDGEEFTGSSVPSDSDFNIDGSLLYVGGTNPGLPLVPSIMPVS